jgi:para-aminobenzoate synthetase component I
VSLLEVHKAAGALERIERALLDEGFFVAGGVAAEGRCADVYLGFGLADGLRRTGRSAPPEPADLPVAACRVRDADEPAPGSAGRHPDASPGPGFEVGAWVATWTAAQYARAVDRVREAIADGEVYQVNLVQHLAAPFGGDPAALGRALAGFRPLAPRPMQGPGWTIASGSPELFLARRGRRLWTMPIKGTRPAGHEAALRASGKDAAEHVMIVDLERNDLGRVCEPGSVRWPEVMAARPLAGVVHLVSTVEGIARPEVSWREVIAALFPGGSVTGAPKVAALDHIAALEPVGRGASMGALGTVWPNGDFELALTIRTFAVVDGRIHLWVGGGVIWDSDPWAEVEEAWVKARPLLAALEGRSMAPLSA